MIEYLLCFIIGYSFAMVAESIRINNQRKQVARFMEDMIKKAEEEGIIKKIE